MGVLDRVKEVASKKKHEFDEGVEREKRYTAYKHPDADYIVHGQRPYGPKTKAQSEEEDAFAARKASEDAKAAERRERNREKKARIKAAVKEKAGNVARNVGSKMRQAMKPQPGRHAVKSAPRQDPLFGGGFGRGFDPVGFGGKQISPLGKAKTFDLGIGRNKKGKPQRFSLF